MKKEVRVLSATGMLGSGFKESSMEKGMRWDPDFIGCDSGTTDFGPSCLGSGKSNFSIEAMRRDLRLIITAARSKGIPAIVGSAGTAGADVHVQRLVKIVEDIAASESLHFKLGIIYCEQDKDYLKKMLSEGKIKPLANAPIITNETIENSAHIVAVVGIEPYIEALENGADVIIAGRSTDTSIYAAIPTMKGINPGSVWHAAKILECGAACVSQRKYPDCMFAVVNDEGFTMEPPNEEYICTPISVASHMLYENSSPYELVEPSGILDTRKAHYKALSDRAVKVTGSHFVPKKLTIKLEGAEKVGYQSIVLGGVRDPFILRQLDSWFEGMLIATKDRFTAIYGAEIHSKYSLQFRVYGRNGSMGKMEPECLLGHEVGVIIEITAESQELASSLAKSASHITLHYPIPEWSGLITGFAYPY
ncbi:MAG: acyclic terpene utilization AtuA family protein, partial [Candidatus Bathyarchaeota archaeon]|nr:acyclic terpene utilization AtuA family protein [Candidatus Bathyarchaeota archaeon]